MFKKKMRNFDIAARLLSAYILFRRTWFTNTMVCTASDRFRETLRTRGAAYDLFE